MYIKLNNGNIEKYPYSIGELKTNNKDVSFPENIPESLLNTFEVYKVVQQGTPSFDALTHKLVEETPNLVNGTWYQDWSIVALPEEEVTLNKQNANEFVKLQRAEAYKNESDPLFFKWQRSEATEQEWLDKVVEIKNRYPNID